MCGQLASLSQAALTGVTHEPQGRKVGHFKAIDGGQQLRMAEKPRTTKPVEFFDEDFVQGAVTSLQKSIYRLKWRIGDGQWPNEPVPVGKNRKLMEEHIDQLIEVEVERLRRGEVTANERTGSVIHRQRQGRMRMTPKKMS
jgi:hypothetical protein